MNLFKVLLCFFLGLLSSKYSWAQADSIKTHRSELGIDLKPLFVRSNRIDIETPYGLSFKYSFKGMAIRSHASWAPTKQTSLGDKYSSLGGRIGCELRTQIYRNIFFVTGLDLQTRKISRKDNVVLTYRIIDSSKVDYSTYHAGFIYEPTILRTKITQIGAGATWALLFPIYTRWLLCVQGRFDYYHGRIRGTLDAVGRYNGINQAVSSGKFSSWLSDVNIAYRF